MSDYTAIQHNHNHSDCRRVPTDRAAAPPAPASEPVVVTCSHCDGLGVAKAAPPAPEGLGRIDISPQYVDGVDMTEVVVNPLKEAASQARAALAPLRRAAAASAPGLLNAAIAERDLKPWRYYRLEYDDLRNALDRYADKYGPVPGSNAAEALISESARPVLSDEVLWEMAKAELAMEYGTEYRPSGLTDLLVQFARAVLARQEGQ